MVLATVNFLLIRSVYDMGRDADVEFDPPARFSGFGTRLDGQTSRARTILNAPFDGGLMQVKDGSAS
jgi:hypothetical protein